ncbi:MAG: GGDEF domain-containing protein [Pseudorhizobium sp.]
MSVLPMLNPFLLAGAEIISEDQKQETLKELFSVRPHVAATAGLLIAAVSAAISGRESAAMVVAAVLAASLTLRVLLRWSFDQRQAGPLKDIWIHLFVGGSLFSGMNYGAAGSLLLFGTDHNTQLLAIGAACAIVQGVAGRAYMMPGVAILNLLLVLCPMSAAAIADGSYLLAPASVVYIGFLTSFVTMMTKLRLRQLTAERLSDSLLEQLRQKNSELEAANAKLGKLATTDSLTGLANRREFDRRIEAALVSAIAADLPLSLLLIDVDHFKNFNDTYGHQAGDACLKAVAQTLRACEWGEGTIVARYGGEEFAVVMPGVSLDQAVSAAERARITIQSTDLSKLPGRPGRQTISIGASTISSDVATSLDELLRNADRALYQAKQQGRNCVSAYVESQDNQTGWGGWKKSFPMN